MADRIRRCQEADVELRKAAIRFVRLYKIGDVFKADELLKELRCAARAFSHACDLAHVGEHETAMIDEWHEQYPLDKEET